jgi:hypothetical protein
LQVGQCNLYLISILLDLGKSTSWYQWPPGIECIDSMDGGHILSLQVSWVFSCKEGIY